MRYQTPALAFVQGICPDETGVRLFVRSANLDDSSVELKSSANLIGFYIRLKLYLL